MRGTTTCSPARRPRRKALAPSTSTLLTDRRTLTPLRWLTWVLAAGQLAERGDDLLHVVGQVHGDVADRAGPRLLAHDGHLGLDVERVVRADLAAEAILQRRDDAAAVGVVLRVGAGDQHHVERQADLVAAHLHVALFEHVEQTDLDALGEVGDLVDGEDAAVGARHQPVVQRQLVAEVAALGDLDRDRPRRSGRRSTCRAWPASRRSDRRGAPSRSGWRRPSRRSDRGHAC